MSQLSEQTCRNGCAHNAPAGAAQFFLKPGEYLGAVGRNRAFEDFTLSLVTHDTPRALPDHAHDWAFLSTLIRGSYVSRTRTSETEFLQNEAVFHPEGFRHTDEIGKGGGAFFCIQLTPRALDEARDGGDSRPRSRTLKRLRDPLAYLNIVQLMHAFCRGADALTCEALLYELAGTLWQESPGRSGIEPRWIARTAERLAEDAPAPFLKDLAADAGVHQTTLSRLFRRYRGRSIGVYRHQERARRAAFEIVSSNAPLGEISTGAGYADQSHMTRELSRLVGLTPAALRQALAN